MFNNSIEIQNSISENNLISVVDKFGFILFTFPTTEIEETNNVIVFDKFTFDENGVLAHYEGKDETILNKLKNEPLYCKLIKNIDEKLKEKQHVSFDTNTVKKLDVLEEFTKYCREVDVNNNGELFRQGGKLYYSFTLDITLEDFIQKENEEALKKHKELERIEANLKIANDEDKHYLLREKYQIIYNLTSIFEMDADYEDKFDNNGHKVLHYTRHWGEEPVSMNIEHVENYIQLWQVCDKLIKQSKDSHHVFIENVVDIDGELQLITGS